MVGKVKSSIISIILIVIIPVQVILGQNKSSRQSAFDSFSAENFDKAYKEFSDLLSAYPKDPLYKYYSAVCLLNLERDPARAESLLSQALASPVKSLPEDGQFWLARSQQMQGKYSEAEKTFKIFSSVAGRKEAKRMGVQEFIKQCKNESGDILVTRPGSIPEIPDSENLNVSPKESLRQNQIKEEIPSDLDKKLGQALDYEYNPALARNVEVKQLEQPAKLDSILSREDTSAQKGKEKDIQQNAMQVKDEIKIAEIKQESIADTITKKATASQNKVVLQEDVTKKDSTKQEQKEELSGVFSVFEILPAPVTDPKLGIEIDSEVPKGLVYRIQLAVFKNPVQLAYFKGILPIYGFKSQTSTIYYAGMFRRLADAEKARVAVRSKGFREAFIAAQMDGKKVSAERAVVLEKEWGKIPLFSSSYEQSNQADKHEPTLMFRVEAARTKQPLTNETVEAMKRISGNRGLDIQRSADGSIVYLIGNFITFESAREYAGLLIRNGYRDAKVVARLGQKEIDIETAKKLFDNLK
jgi:tetratricopeptide (TPR) repeat protein